MTESPRDIRQGVNSVDVAVAMLRVLADLRRPVSLSEMARELDVSPGKVHRYFVSLMRGGLIAQQPETGKYELGAFSLKLGLAALHQVDAVRFASEEMPAFRDQIDRTVLLAVWSEAGPVVVRLDEATERVTMNVRVGSILPVATSAIGRVFTAYLPAGQADALFEREQGLRESVGRLSRDEIVAEVRKDGLARVDSYGLPGIGAIAVPVLDQQDYPAAVVAVLSLKEVDRLAKSGPTAEALRGFARRISGRIGGDLRTP